MFVAFNRLKKHETVGMTKHSKSTNAEEKWVAEPKWMTKMFLLGADTWWDGGFVKSPIQHGSQCH